LDATTPPLQGRLDLQRVGVAGHSFGAYTTLAIAGQSGMGGRLSQADARVKAAIPMSAPVPAGARRDLDSAYGTIRIPCLHMTGTRDSSPIGETTIAQRRLPYDHSRNSDQYLLTFQDGDHMIFSGRPRQTGGGELDELFQGHIRSVSLAFWDAYLRGDAAAKAWLSKDFAAALGQHGTWEQRLLAPAAP
jgi:predicted dienelactone hydrolase